MCKINEGLRAQGKGFILSETLGAAGYGFVDFGDNHQVFDIDGEATKQFIVSNVSNDKEAIVTPHEDKRHSYQDGDYVKFVEVQGMEELNSLPHTKIKNCTKDSFTLELDTTSFNKYTR